MGRLLIRRAHDLKRLLEYVVLPLLIVGVIGGLTIPCLQRPRTVEASAAMFASPAPIDGKRAYGYLKQICDIGPRTAGSEANGRQRKLVKGHFEKKGGAVREQPFRALHPVTGERLVMVNLIGSWNPERLQRVVIGAHYDTRPHPDQEDLPNRQKLPFLGANDGASGVALLMEIANHLATLETPWGVDLVLFDGEELVFGNDPRVGEYFLGSNEFARIYADQRDHRRSKMHYAAGLVLDMVGGRDLKINQEPTSSREAPDLVREVWAVARGLGARSFRFQEGREVLDDHLALIRAGIPAIDIIDFDYPYWHKADDLPENCSAESLAEVGRVVTAWLALPRHRTRR
ncbi:MAG TPA: M28 family peptidase [Isosphaeraceae bacterium]|nr:M28 family peptidase [Isosphaeraceae bacterium]